MEYGILVVESEDGQYQIIGPVDSVSEAKEHIGSYVIHGDSCAVWLQIALSLSDGCNGDGTRAGNSCTNPCAHWQLIGNLKRFGRD